MTQSSVGRKILMAVTGLVLLGFVIVHLLGNTSVFVGPDGINAYAEKLHSLGPVVYIFRLVMLAAFAIHIIYGIQLTLENRAASPAKYAIQKRQRATFASSTMIVSGLVLLAFVIYHLLHFTVQVTDPAISAKANLDALGRPDVYLMVVKGFQKIFVSLIYVVSMVFLFLHLSHGAQSFVQTFGLTNANTLPAVNVGGKALSAILLLGYIAIPLLIVIGFVKI
nr:succinate dehydrogenase cytochrome b subunit [Desulfuromonas versatilis]